MIFVGIDAGGTRVRCAAVSSGGNLVGITEGPGANVHLHGPQTTARRLIELTRRAVGRQIDGDSPVYAAVCAAGLDTDEVETALAENLETAAPDIVWLLANDAVGAWKGAFGEATSGVIAISGTGSVALARRNGAHARAGGWGVLLGDEGSGYDLGRRALVSVLRHHDNIGRATSLCEPLMRQLGLARPADIIDHVHFQMQPADVAALAPLILEHAGEGDPVAREQVDAAASAVVELACGAASAVRAASNQPMPFALVGGVARDAYFCDRVRLRSSDPRLSLCWQEPQASPLLGAVTLALEAASARHRHLRHAEVLTPELTAAIEAEA